MSLFQCEKCGCMDNTACGCTGNLAHKDTGDDNIRKYAICIEPRVQNDSVV